jgi:hypothetical protein
MDITELELHKTQERLEKKPLQESRQLLIEHSREKSKWQV